MAKPRRTARGQRTDATGHSVGSGAHVRLYRWELKSAAYGSLTTHARALLVELKALYNGTNNGELFLSVRRAAERLGIGKNLAARCFKELQDRGFIRVKRPAAFNMKSGARRGEATIWILTEYAVGDALPTKDFMRWQAPMNGKRRARKSFDGTRPRHTSSPSEGQSTVTEAEVSPREGHLDRSTAV
jgi:hypothetical protein